MNKSFQLNILTTLFRIWFFSFEWKEKNIYLKTFVFSFTWVEETKKLHQQYLFEMTIVNLLVTITTAAIGSPTQNKDWFALMKRTILKIFFCNKSNSSRIWNDSRAPTYGKFTGYEVYPWLRGLRTCRPNFHQLMRIAISSRWFGNTLPRRNTYAIHCKVLRTYRNLWKICWYILLYKRRQISQDLLLEAALT